MPTLFQTPIWVELKPFAKVVTYSRRHGLARLEFNIPGDLLSRALSTYANCVSCGSLLAPVRLRKVATERSRVAGSSAAKRAFYAAACLSDVNSSCQRTKAARVHMDGVRLLLGASRCADESIQLRSYRALCDQLEEALLQRSDAQLVGWFRFRRRAIDRVSDPARRLLA